MKKKSVLICYHSSNYGGVEKQILDIISGLSSKYNFYIVCPNGPLVNDYLSAGAVKHIDLAPKFEADLVYSYKIFKLIKEHNIQIVHSHELRCGCLATFGAWVAQCEKRIYHVHTPFVMWNYGGLKKYPALIINLIVNFIVGNFFATHVLALTESIKKIRARYEFIIPHKIRVIPNGIDLDKLKFDESLRDSMRKKFSVSNDTILLGHLGRFTEEKHQDLIIKAVSEIKKDRGNKIKALLAGGGKLLDENRRLAENLNVNNEIIFTGHFDDNDKKALLSAMDFFIFPSNAEGFGIVLVEAMSVGLTCVASDLDVLKDVGGEYAYYFKCENLEDLVSKLKASFENPINKDSVKNRAAEFSIQNFWAAYEKLYN